jgi:site-specific recombinase XerD
MWRLGRSLPERVGRGEASRGEAELIGRERALGLRPGQPFLLRPDGVPDVDVLGYFASPSFGLLSDQTQLSYAKDLRLFLSFLEGQGRRWREASFDDALDYEFWRRRDERNPRRVSASKFAREWAACQRFYLWQQRRGVVAGSPSSVIDPGGSAGLRSHREARSNRVKWLTPRAYSQWRSIGLAGCTLDGERDSRWRGRNDGRNTAFADLLWSSGLRLREGGSLLLMELPGLDAESSYLAGRIGPEVAKMRRGRDFWVSREALSGIEAYVLSSRAAAIGRAHQAGRYTSGDRLLLTDRHGPRLTVREESTGRDRAVLVGDLSLSQRRQLFVQGPGGWEPAMVFLGESGVPMDPDSWERVFAQASRRCHRLGVPVSCHPHMLRHSFALRMLLTLTHAFDRRMGLTPEERREYRLMFGDPWVLVQTLLGHRSPETTRSIYLEPVSGLQVELFLNDDGVSEDAAFSSTVTRHLARTGLVNLGMEA